MARIFISYKRVDKEQVFKIKDQIESALGEKCWIDLDGIESDAQFKSVIIKAINDCEIVLFMYSKVHTQIIDYTKDWTIRELNYASLRGKRIVFVNLDGSILTDELAFDYGTKQQIDATNNESIFHLLVDLGKWLNYDRKISQVSNTTCLGKSEENIKGFPAVFSFLRSKIALLFAILSIATIIISIVFTYHFNDITSSVRDEISDTIQTNSNKGTYDWLSMREITRDELKKYNKDTLSILRNSIYARHGYKFQNEKILNFFNQYDWYKGQYDNVNDKLTRIERYNIQLLKEAENSIE